LTPGSGDGASDLQRGPDDDQREADARLSSREAAAQFADGDGAAAQQVAERENGGADERQGEARDGEGVREAHAGQSVALEGGERNSGWTPAFEGQRRPYGSGNGAAVTHGAYSPLRLQPRAEDLREQLAPLVPFATAADAPLVDLLSFTMAQVERAALVLAIEQAESQRAVEQGLPPSPRLDRLAADSRAWVKTGAKLLDQLGLSPTSRARLAGDLAGAEKTLTARALREQYGEAA
jgi:hypothetical protein